MLERKNALRVQGCQVQLKMSADTVMKNQHFDNYAKQQKYLSALDFCREKLYQQLTCQK